MVTAHNTLVARHPIQWYIRGMVVIIQKGTDVWVGSPSHTIYKGKGKVGEGVGENAARFYCKAQ